MKPMVFLKDIPEIRVKAFGDEHGELHFITYEMLDFVYGERAVLLDMTGKGVMHVKDCTRYVDVPLQRYGGYGNYWVIAGFYKDAEKAVWIVED